MTETANIPPVKLHLFSFGLKTVYLPGNDGKTFGVIPKADLIIDCRSIKEHGLDRNNPLAYPTQLKEHCSGTLQAILMQIIEAVKLIPERRAEKTDPYKDPFTICFCCAYGMNRSPTTKRVIADCLIDMGYDVTVKPSLKLGDSL